MERKGKDRKGLEWIGLEWIGGEWSGFIFAKLNGGGKYPNLRERAKECLNDA